MKCSLIRQMPYWKLISNRNGRCEHFESQVEFMPPPSLSGLLTFFYSFLPSICLQRRQLLFLYIHSLNKISLSTCHSAFLLNNILYFGKIPIELKIFFEFTVYSQSSKSKWYIQRYPFSHLAITLAPVTLYYREPCFIMLLCNLPVFL